MTTHTPTPVAEIVTFRLVPGTAEAPFLAAAAAAQAWLTSAPGFLSRRLSRGEDGTWTDHVAWASRTDALAAADAFPSDPRTEAFLRCIDMKSLAMRHDRLALSAGTA